MNDIYLTFQKPHLIVRYHEKSTMFSVESAETHCGYFVPRGDLVGDFRYFCEIVNQLLLGCEQNADVDFDPPAYFEIELIREANIVLF